MCRVSRETLELTLPMAWVLALDLSWEPLLPDRERDHRAGEPLALEARIRNHARSPLRIAPCTVAQSPSPFVASPANKRGPTGSASRANAGRPPTLA